jgi:hypothetical protein
MATQVGCVGGRVGYGRGFQSQGGNVTGSETADVETPSGFRRLDEADEGDGTLSDECGVGIADFAVHRTTVTETLYRQNGKFYLCEEHQFPEPVNSRFFFLHQFSTTKAKNWLWKFSVGVKTEDAFAARIAEIESKEKASVGK